MYAGVAGQGAMDGSYATAVYMEAMKLLEVGYSGGAADLFKCFDRTIKIARLLFYPISILAGIPREVIAAYVAYQKIAMVYNKMSGALGTPQ